MKAEGKQFSSPCVCLFTSVLLQLASNVSSFAVCNDFLLITTHSHTCRCLHLSSLSVKGRVEAESFQSVMFGSTVLPEELLRLLLPLVYLMGYLSWLTFDPAGLQVALASDGNQNDETLRRVERGSRIVTVVPQDTRVILQVSLTHERLFHVKLIKLREFVLTLVVLICVCVCSDASWEPGDCPSSSAGVGSAQKVARQVSLTFFHHTTFDFYRILEVPKILVWTCTPNQVNTEHDGIKFMFSLQLCPCRYIQIILFIYIYASPFVLWCLNERYPVESYLQFLPSKESLQEKIISLHLDY